MGVFRRELSTKLQCAFSISPSLATYPVHHAVITAWSTVRPEKLTIPKRIKEFLTFYGTLGSLPHSQDPAIYPYPDPDQSSSHHAIQYLKILTRVIPEVCCWVQIFLEHFVIKRSKFMCEVWRCTICNVCNM